MMPTMLPESLRDYAHCDVYLLDQIFKGRVQAGMRVLDVGCGGGRNSRALLALGCTVTMLDPDPQAIAHAQQHCSTYASTATYFTGTIAAFNTAQPFDAVICNAVLHFAPDQQTWYDWADACWAQLKPGGLFFARLSTRLVLPDAHPPGFGYRADLESIMNCEIKWGARRVDPLKSTAVENLRCMSTWVLTSS